MLDDINKVNWTKVKEENPGLTEEIPVLLKNLLLKDSSILINSIQKLDRMFISEESLNEGVVYFIPFLFEILEKVDSFAQCQILDLLIAIEDFNMKPDIFWFDYYIQQMEKTKSTEDKEYNDFVYERKIEIEGYNKIHNAMLDGTDICLSLLDNINRKVQIKAALLLSFFIERREKIIPSFLKKINTEKEEKLQEFYIMFLTRIDQEGKNSSKFYKLNSMNPFLQYTIAWRIALTKKKNTPLEIIKIIIEAYRGSIDMELGRKFEDTYLFNYIWSPHEAFKAIGIGAKDYFSILFSDAHYESGSIDYDALDSLLYILFDPKNKEENMRNLSDNQRFLLKHLLNSSNSWDENEEYDFPTLQKLGLPNRKDEIEKLLSK